MAKLGSVFINTVYSDKVTRSIKVSEHAVESGESVADHIAVQQQTFPITGVVIGADASNRLKQLEEFSKNGTILKYVNRITASNVIISSFDSTHAVKVANGFEFSMTLRRIKIVGDVKTAEMTVPARTKIKTETNKGAQQKTTVKQSKKKTEKKKKEKKKKKDNTTVKQTGKSPAQLAKENGYKNRK